MSSDPFRRPPQVLDMTPEGEFREPPRKPAASRLDRALARVGGVAALVTLALGGLLLAAVALTFVAVLIPVVLAAGAVAAVAIWWRLRRLRKQGVAVPRFVIIRR